MSAVLAVVAPTLCTAIRCLQSTCSDDFCLSQDVVSTEMVDCALRVSTYTVEQDDGSFITYDLPAGRSANNAPFDACQKSAIQLGGGMPVVTTYDCATTDLADRQKYKCHQATYGTEPWSADGMTENPAGGAEYVYYCCSTDECTSDDPSDSADADSDSDSGSGGTAVSAPSPPGFHYSQDPAWQDGTGRNCVCEARFDDATGEFDLCEETAWANPLLQTDNLGECAAFSDLGTNTWRIKLQGIGTKPGFGVNVEQSLRESWQGWCVNCDGARSQVHFYSDHRCSHSALVSTYEFGLDECAVDDSRSMYYSATCGVDPDYPALPCPGTVAVQPLALSVGVHSNAECRGATVGGFEWRLPVAALEAAPAGESSRQVWGAGGACIPFKLLESEGLDAGGFLLGELLQLRTTSGVGFGPGTPLGELYPGTPAPDSETVAFQVCASVSSGLRLAWYSDLSCSSPMVLSAPLTGGWATSSTELLSTNGTTGIDYGFECDSAGNLPMRSSRAQPLMADGLSVVQRWVYVELNTTALPMLSSCPALPPPPPFDVDCTGDWEPCTAACEEERVWIQTRSPSGLGEACPIDAPCASGEGECTGSTKLAVDSGVVLMILLIGVPVVLGLVCVVGCCLLCRRKMRYGKILPDRKQKKKKKVKLDGISDSDSTDSDEETSRRRQQLEDIRSGKKTKEEVKAENDALKAEKVAKIKAKMEASGQKSVLQMMKEKQQAVQQAYQEKHGGKIKGGSDDSSDDGGSSSSDDEDEKRKSQHDADATAAGLAAQASQMAMIMSAKQTAKRIRTGIQEPEPEPEEQISLDSDSSSDTDSESGTAHSNRSMHGAGAMMRGASAMMRGRGGGRGGGRGSRGGRGRARGRGFARAAGALSAEQRAMGAFGRGRGAAASGVSEVPSDSERQAIHEQKQEETAKMREKLAAAEKDKARAKAKAKAMAKARARGARGTYMTDSTAAPQQPDLEPEPEPEPLPGQPLGTTEPKAGHSWLDDAPGGTRAKAKAAAVAARVPPKLRISTMTTPQSLSSLDLKEALRQQQEQFSNLGLTEEQQQAEDEAAKAKTRAKARARAVAAARQRQGLGGRNSVVEGARNAAVQDHHSFKQAGLVAAASDELGTPAQKVLRALPADDLKSLQAMLREMDEQ